MGKRNSTITRVMPLCDYLKEHDNNVICNINKFLSLFPKKIEIKNDSEILEFCYGKSKIYIDSIKGKPVNKEHIKNRTQEKSLRPSIDLLKWCVNNVSLLKKEEFEKLRSEVDETSKKRYSLYKGDLAIKEEALKELKKGNVPITSWFVFEGCTYPDIYIETDDMIFVGEAKRLEDDITRSTKWLEQRDQLIRHIDAVIDRQKNVYAFYIVDDPKKYDLAQYKDLNYYKLNAPHRSSDTIEKMMRSYIGYTTWSDVNSAFENKIPFPDTIDDYISNNVM